MAYISLGSNCSIAYQLNKYGLRKTSYPFDWCCLNINQLINVLENDFEDFENFTIKKLSDQHLEMDSNKPTYIITNKYGVKMAHELCEGGDVEEMKGKIKRRIIRMKNDEPKIFIRIELNNLTQKNFEEKYTKLIKILDKKYPNFKLIIISKNNRFIINDMQSINYIHFYQLDRFSDDWKMDDLDWFNMLSLTD
jgi:hypothetical protein